jgi:tetratricopeptide (TPR) repeat protein
MLWDDASHVTRPDLRSLHGLWRIWFDLGATQQYYPLLHSAFWLEHSIWGDAVLGYHLANVGLHALAACLVVRIARRMALPGAWLAGLLFALHPLCVESVAWISEQKSTLSGVFYLGALLVYLDFDETRRWSRYLAALALFILALLSKTVTATLPGALLVILWWRHGRIGWRRDVQPLVPWLVLGAAAGLFTAWVERTLVGAAGVEFSLTPIERLLLAGRAICFYAGKAIWPANFTFFYPRWNIDPGEWWQYLFPAAVVAVGLAFGRLSRRNRGPLAALLFFAGTLFPVLGFFNVYPFRYSYVADHFAYLASLGILVPAASLAASSAAKLWSRWPASVLLPAILIAGLGGLTWRQAATYQDEETLYRATLARNPGAWLAHNNLGNLLLPLGGRRVEAMAHFQEALSLKPDFWEAHLSLGNALLETPGRLDDAIAQYETAVLLAPNSERAHTNLGNALLQAGRTAEAVAHLQTALRIDPGSAEAHNDLGNALTHLPGGLSAAIAEYRAALRANPDFAEPHNNLGRALAQSGDLPAAMAEFEAAIRLRPDSWSAHNNLGNALSQLPGRLPDAISEYRAALRIRPDSAATQNNLGYALAQMPGLLPDAVTEYRKALQLNPGLADAHYNLGEALLRLPGHEAEALSEFEAVLRLKPSPRVQEIVGRLRARQK